MAGTGEPVQRIGDRPGGSPNSLGNTGRTQRLFGVFGQFGQHQLGELPTAESLVARDLLGRNGWLDRFRVAIVHYNREIFLSPHDSDAG